MRTYNLFIYPAVWLILANVMTLSSQANETKAFSFAAYGHYIFDRNLKIDPGFFRLRTAIDATNPEFVVHVGDAMRGNIECPDKAIGVFLEALSQHSSPLIYTPGDNDWSECISAKWKPNIINRIKRRYVMWRYKDVFRDPIYDSRRALRTIRQLAFPPSVSLGKRTIPLSRQNELASFKAFPENAHWVRHGILAATFHIIGGANNYQRDRAEFERRNMANLSWLDTVFGLAAQEKIVGIILFAQEAPFGYRQANHEQLGPGYNSFNKELTRQVRELQKPIIFIHGSGASLRVDNPLFDDMGLIKNFTRVRVFDQDDERAVLIKVRKNLKALFEISVISAAQN